MPKKKPDQKKRLQASRVGFVKKSFSKLRSFVIKHKIISIVIAAALLWALVWIGQVGVERYRFAQAEKKLDRLASEIQAVLPTDKQLIKEKGCDYSSRKFSRGDRSCSIRFSVSFHDYSLEKANSTAYTIQKAVLSSDEFKIKQPRKDEFPFKIRSDLFLSNIQRHNIDLHVEKTKNEPACGAEFRYEVVPANYDNPQANLAFVVSCYGSAKAEYFSVKD